MLAGQGNRPLRLRYRAACEAGAANRFPSHANPGEGRRRGGEERRSLALGSAERKIDYRNDARFEGTSLEGTTLGGTKLAGSLQLCSRARHGGFVFVLV